MGEEKRRQHSPSKVTRSIQVERSSQPVSLFDIQNHYKTETVIANLHICRFSVHALWYRVTNILLKVAVHNQFHQYGMSRQALSATINQYGACITKLIK